MTTERLEKLLRDGEGFTVEFKECVHEISLSVYETVCSFSNRYGGTILLGVRDSGEVIGVDRTAADDMRKNFINCLNNPNLFAPTLWLSLEKFEYDGKLILYADVTPTSQVVFFKSRIYDRNGDADNNVTKSTEVVAGLFAVKAGQFSERHVFPYAELADMRLDLVDRAKAMALAKHPNHPWQHLTGLDFFRSAGLYEKDRNTGKEGFNLAGILLFGTDDAIRACCVGAVTDCILRRENLDRYDDRLIVETNLIEAYDQIFAWIERHTLDRFFLVDNVSISVRSWIAREIVSNILAHREYTSSYRAQVVITNDAIAAVNASRSTFQGPLTPEDFTPRSKNPLIAKTFLNIGRADELGSGVRNLYKYTRIYTDGRTPELLEGDVFRITVPITTTADKPHSPENKVYPLTDKVYTLNLDDNETAVLEYLRENPAATQQEIANSIHKSLPTVKNVMARLQVKKVLLHDGAKKNGRWVILNH
jgi:ATP-dependent DNA helicase RecG